MSKKNTDRQTCRSTLNYICDDDIANIVRVTGQFEASFHISSSSLLNLLFCSIKSLLESCSLKFLRNFPQTVSMKSAKFHGNNLGR